jgi:very-short-patch-repair endonuclease
VAAASELYAVGVSRAMLRRWIRQRKLVGVAPGVYTLPGLLAAIDDDHRKRYAIVVAAAIQRDGHGLVASHESAAFLHHLNTLAGEENTQPDITLTRSPDIKNRASRAYAHIHVAGLPAEHVTTYRGVQVTTVARTVIDIARAGSFLEGAVVADSALRSRLTTRAELVRVAQVCTGWRGSVQANDVIRFADSRAESVLETLARVRFREIGLEPPRLQVNVRGPHGFIGRVDFCWWDLQTVAEADGVRKYREDPLRLARDQLRRDELLREAGWGVVHFDWREIFHEPHRVGARILATYRQR